MHEHSLLQTHTVVQILPLFSRFRELPAAELQCGDNRKLQSQSLPQSGLQHPWWESSWSGGWEGVTDITPTIDPAEAPDTWRSDSYTPVTSFKDALFFYQWQSHRKKMEGCSSCTDEISQECLSGKEHVKRRPRLWPSLMRHYLSSPPTQKEFSRNPLDHSTTLIQSVDTEKWRLKTENAKFWKSTREKTKSIN